MNNISALNQVFANLHQNIAALGGRVNAVFAEVETVKTSVKKLEQSQVSIAETSSEPAYVTVEDFNKLSHQVVELKTVEGDIVSNVREIETLVSKQANELKNVVDTVAGLKIVVDNLTSSVTHTPSLTKEDVQALIDSAINALIGVLTSSNSNLSAHTTLSTIEEDVSGDDVTNDALDEVQESVETEQPVTEVMVVEPTKKKGRGGRKPAIKK